MEAEDVEKERLGKQVLQRLRHLVQRTAVHVRLSGSRSRAKCAGETESHCYTLHYKICNRKSLHYPGLVSDFILQYSSGYDGYVS